MNMRKDAKICGTCKHTDNDLGIVALHCVLLRDYQLKNEPDGIPDGKVRSWNKCELKPNQWEKRGH